MQELARGLVVAGVLLVLLGALLWAAPSIPWLGRLPGDIRIEREGFRLYVPLASCLLLSAVLTLGFWLVTRR